jgi:hypothetical protein
VVVVDEETVWSAAVLLIAEELVASCGWIDVLVIGVQAKEEPSAWALVIWRALVQEKEWKRQAWRFKR